MDVRLYNSDDGGAIDVENGRFSMADGLETAVYLSLFGGNEKDSGGQDGERFQWWGNLDEQLPERRYRSETQHLIEGLPMVPRNLLRMEDAAGRDLAWMVQTGLATSVSVRASIPALNTIKLRLDVIVNDKVHPFEFIERGKYGV